MIVPRLDNLFHPPQRNHLFWNESAWFSLCVPEKLLDGFIYVNHRPNMRYSMGGVALWDAFGSQPYDCLYYDWTLHPLPDEAQMFDFALENGFSIETVEPMKAYRIHYKGGGLGYVGDYCDVDLTWESLIDPKELSLSDDAKWWMGDHYEQIGKMRGTVSVRGETTQVDCYSIRDHSWGPRRPKFIARSSFAWGIASPTDAFCVWTAQELPHEQDPLIGTNEKLRHGWYLKDGVLSELEEAERRVGRGEDGLHISAEISGRDALGRKLAASGEIRSRLNFTGYPEMMISWALTDWTFDGKQAWGEEHDSIPIQVARRFLRSLNR